MGQRAKERKVLENYVRKRRIKVRKINGRTYDEETKAINRMRGMLEDESNQKRAAMMKAMQEENQRLALEKKMREERDKDWNLNKNSEEISRDD